MKQNSMSTLPRIAFFGSPQIAVWVLEALEAAGITPHLVVTNPDTPQGRKMLLTPTPVAQWTAERGIKTLKPATLRNEDIVAELIVAAYGKMIPENVLSIPKYKTLNVHPSLLPQFRGASPIRSAILADVNPTGVSIMELTLGMDEGPLLAQKEFPIAREEWPLRGSALDELLAKEGGKLLASLLPAWVEGTLTPTPQTGEPTYCAKISKDMGLLDLTADPYQNLLKIRAFDGWPGTYFFVTKNDTQMRVKVVDAELAEDGTLRITRVIPEGKKEMPYEDFLRG
jgi:methionyl-tRNA formyltransferase